MMIAPQSILEPAGPTAQAIHELGVIMYIGAAVVTLLVTTLMIIPFVSKHRKPVNRKLFLWGGGVALPLITLTALVPYIFTIGHETRAAVPRDALTVDITGHQFWWQMTYRPAGQRGTITGANELRVPAGQPVQLWLRSADVIHSFWIPRLAGKMDLIPGRANRMVIEATEPGRYRGQCAEYCGQQHAWMAFDVVVMPADSFNQWLARMAQPVPQPAAAELRDGRALFEANKCGRCHTLRGVSQSALGPDLTNIGARTMIGAGALPNGVGNLAGWISSAQHIKPGIDMPAFNTLSGPQLRALASYLYSLE